MKEGAGLGAENDRFISYIRNTAGNRKTDAHRQAVQNSATASQEPSTASHCDPLELDSAAAHTTSTMCLPSSAFG